MTRSNDIIDKIQHRLTKKNWENHESIGIEKKDIKSNLDDVDARSDNFWKNIFDAVDASNRFRI